MAQTAFHSITPMPWEASSFGERVAVDTITAVLWPLRDDARMTVLISLLATQTADIATDDDQIDAIIDLLRPQLVAYHETQDQHRV